MFLDAELHVAYKIGNVPIFNFPFPHFYLENIFPDDFYSKIQENLLEKKEMTSMADLYPQNTGLSAYKDRYVMDFTRADSMKKVSKKKQEFWTAFGESFSRGPFGNLIQSRFKRFLDMRFQYLENVSFRHEMQLINDKKNYSLGPHTDKPSKVISVLIYLPKDFTQKETGTTIYMPKDPELLNKDLPHVHYPHEQFHRVITLPFVPNSAFCFIKTNNSFHGVEKLENEKTDRWSLQYNLHITNETLDKEIVAKNKHHNQKNESAEKVKSNFSM